LRNVFHVGEGAFRKRGRYFSTRDLATSIRFSTHSDRRDRNSETRQALRAETTGDSIRELPERKSAVFWSGVMVEEAKVK
jgi:hypothetical protein